MNWWLRSPNLNNSNNAWNVNTDGQTNNNNCSNTYGIRPALMDQLAQVTPAWGRKQYPIIKGSYTRSPSCAWDGDKYITPRQAAPRQRSAACCMRR